MYGTRSCSQLQRTACANHQTSRTWSMRSGVCARSTLHTHVHEMVDLPPNALPVPPKTSQALSTQAMATRRQLITKTAAAIAACCCSSCRGMPASAEEPAPSLYGDLSAPYQWGGTCASGRKQSPINIPPASAAQLNGSTAPLKSAYKPSRASIKKTAGGTMQVRERHVHAGLRTGTPLDGLFPKLIYFSLDYMHFLVQHGEVQNMSWIYIAHQPNARRLPLKDSTCPVFALAARLSLQDSGGSHVAHNDSLGAKWPSAATTSFHKHTCLHQVHHICIACVSGEVYHVLQFLIADGLRAGYSSSQRSHSSNIGMNHTLCFHTPRSTSALATDAQWAISSLSCCSEDRVVWGGLTWCALV